MEAQLLGLARLLYAQPRPRNLQLLKCKGVFKDTDGKCYGIVYQLPRHLQHVGKQLQDGQLNRRLPTNLAQLLTRSIKDLGHRFALVQKPVESLIAMHASNWLHKNIQSTPVLFFPVASSTGKGPRGDGEINYDQPYLMGCQFSRPSDELHDGVQRSRETMDPDAITMTPYQHPDEMEDPEVCCRYSYEVYSLGIVLLEIGRWKPVDKGQFSGGVRARIAEMVRLSERLKGSCGNFFARCVRQCLY